MSQSQTPATRSPDGESGARPTEEQIREELTRVLASHEFRISKRSQDFLRFVVEHTLHGDADILKERTIGIEVFGRPTSYDPSDDATVRVKAGEVRKRLGLYYSDSWRAQPVAHRTAIGNVRARISRRVEAPPVETPATERPAPARIRCARSPRRRIRGGPAPSGRPPARRSCARSVWLYWGVSRPGIDRARSVLGAGAARFVAGAGRRRVRSGVESRPAARRPIEARPAGFRRTHRSIRRRRRSDRDLAPGIDADAASSSLSGEGGLRRFVRRPAHRPGDSGGLFLHALARDQQPDAILHRRLARSDRHHRQRQAHRVGAAQSAARPPDRAKTTRLSRASSIPTRTPCWWNWPASRNTAPTPPATW